MKRKGRKREKGREGKRRKEKIKLEEGRREGRGNRKKGEKGEGGGEKERGKRGGRLCGSLMRFTSVRRLASRTACACASCSSVMPIFS
jgi:hypothetical protein